MLPHANLRNEDPHLSVLPPAQCAALIAPYALSNDAP
jgi:hypothetical protein